MTRFVFICPDIREGVHEPYGVSKADLTELAQTDCLHRPSGMIDQAQRRIAQIYGVDKSRMLINGNSAGLLAAILSGFFSERKSVVASRQSFVNLSWTYVARDGTCLYLSRRRNVG